MTSAEDTKLPQPASQEQVDRLKTVGGPSFKASCDQYIEEIAPYPLAPPAAAQIWPRVFPGL